jgi:hypothetical protein
MADEALDNRKIKLDFQTQNLVRNYSKFTIFFSLKKKIVVSMQPYCASVTNIYLVKRTTYFSKEISSN